MEGSIGEKNRGTRVPVLSAKQNSAEKQQYRKADPERVPTSAI
jgi:hypothetical protein